MTDRERLIRLMREACRSKYDYAGNIGLGQIADYLLEHGVIVPPETGIGDVSDGYHTFNELYHHRAVLFSVICNTFKDKAWKSKKHDTGDMFDGMFIVGIETPQGQATYHYDINPYWDMFKVKELPNAPKWDGHTPEEAIRRISMLQVDNVIVLPCKVGDILCCESAIKGHITYFEAPDLAWIVENRELFGKEIFFSGEEAEKALKERER